MVITNIIFFVSMVFFVYYMLGMFHNMNIKLVKIEARIDDMLKNRLDGSNKQE